MARHVEVIGPNATLSQPNRTANSAAETLAARSAVVSEMPKEPLARERSYMIQSARLLEQVRRARHDLEPCFGPHLAHRRLVHIDDRCVQSADDEQRRRDDAS